MIKSKRASVECFKFIERIILAYRLIVEQL